VSRLYWDYVIFRYFYEEIANVSVGNTIKDSANFFLTKSSINKCRECLHSMAADRMKEILEYELCRNCDSIDQLEDLLDNKMSYALLDMSHLPICRLPQKE